MIKDSRRYAEDVAIHGMSDTHKQVINWVPRGARVLELGCSSGYIGRVLIEQKSCSVTGAEFDGNAAAEARAAGLTVYQGSLEDPAFRASIEGVFDIVIAADVLEHLANPEVVLGHFRQWLAPSGRAIIAVPNVACWEIRRGLFFRGAFRYQESGIMDRTHLHFFTWETFHELLTEKRYRVLDTMTEMQQIPLVGPVSNRRPPTRITRLRHRHKNSKPLARLALAPWAIFSEAYAWITTTLADAIIYKWPNLCIGHVAVLVEPRD